MGLAGVFFLVAVEVAFLVVLLLAAGFFSVFSVFFSVFLVEAAAFLGAAALEAAALGAAAFWFGESVTLHKQTVRGNDNLP